MTLEIIGPIAESDHSRMFGPAGLEPGLGIDLAEYGYVEEEFLLRGHADLYGYGEGFETVLDRAAVPFTTRVVVRRPADPARFSGSVQLEPLHMELDWAPTWQAAATYLLREGHAHVGVTTFAFPLKALAEFEPDRYGGLHVEDEGLGYDIVGQVGTALREGGTLLGGARADRLTMTGWSATGSFIRTFINDGFSARARAADGENAFTGFVVVIAGGGDVKLGYWPLSATSGIPPVTHSKRVIRGAGSPVIELLTEYEAESNGPINRADSDDPADRYRMYQVAGMSHVNASGEEDRFTQPVQLARRGVEPPPREINEVETDARFDVIVTAVLERLEHWVRDGTPPPHAQPLTVLTDNALGISSVWPEAFPLERDADGLAVGGVRTHWVDVPTARYVPHSTPRPGRCELPPGIPLPGPEYFTDIIAHRVPFTRAKLAERYGSWEVYRDRAIARIDRMVDEGWLLEPEAELLRADLRNRSDWDPASL